MDSLFRTVNDWLKAIVSLGLGLALVFLVVDVLFPNQTDIVANVADLVNSFTSRGIVGLVILIALVAVAFED
jgi:hypothetical protein|tara:strand:- start:231 stop:446 length:216 start_codon:yes stop_codon:yes gene_type:complete